MLLTGCGFQLRGADQTTSWPAHLETLQLKFVGSVDPDFRTRLRTQLTSQFNVQIVPASAPTLVVKDVTQDRRVLTLSATGKVSEYLLHLDASFFLVGRDGNKIFDKQSVRLRQAFSFDETDILAIEVEQARLSERMQIDAVRRILRRVIALSKINR